MSSRSTCRALSSLILVYILIVSICSPPLIEVTASSSGAKRAAGVVAKGSRPTKSALLTSQSVHHGGRREGELLARFRLGLTIEQQRLIVASSGAKEWRLLRGESRVGKVMLHPGQTIEAAMLALRSNRSVEFAEPNYLIHKDTVKNSVNSPSLPGPFKGEAQSSGLSQIYQSPARSFSNQLEDPPNAWRGIIPLYSTRAAVERLLGNHKWSHGATFIYESESERVDVLYSKGVCKLSGVELWRVPQDVVIKIEVASRGNIFVRDLKLDPSRYVRQEESHPENWVEYRSVDDGIRVKAMLDGKEEKILLITYEPRTKDKQLQCPPN